MLSRRTNWRNNVRCIDNYLKQKRNSACHTCFFLKFLADTCPFLGATSTPVLDFWWHLWVSKPEWVLPYLLFAEVNVMHTPQDPPLQLHMLTSWQPAHSQSLPHMHSPHALPTCMCRGGTYVGFEWAITRSEDERHTCFLDQDTNK